VGQGAALRAVTGAVQIPTRAAVAAPQR
jgi:hypothetical protein